jgi:hypothetical protein
MLLQPQGTGALIPAEDSFEEFARWGMTRQSERVCVKMYRFAFLLTCSLLAFTAAGTDDLAYAQTCTVGGTGTNNTCLGTGALSANPSGSNNTASGFNALNLNTTGGSNTATGASALSANISGNSNTATGFNALNKNTASSNTASGASALSANTTGGSNTAMGASALIANVTGGNNTAVGSNALPANQAGGNNTAVGVNALLNSSGSGNIAIGFNAGSALTTGGSNIAIGSAADAADTSTIRIGSGQTRTFVAGIRGTSVSGGLAVVVDAAGQLGVAAAVPGGTSNTATGVNALMRNSSGVGNTASGSSALQENTTGSRNTAFGLNALFSNGVGASNNTAIGANALWLSSGGSNNTAFGVEAAQNQTTGSNNLALGYQAGNNWSTGNNNIALAAPGTAGESGTIRIGIEGIQTRAFIAGIRGVAVNGGQTVVVDANGQLGVAPGSTTIPGDNNTALGTGALSSNTVSGTNNTAAGSSALTSNTTGTQNTASGAGALQANTGGNFNTASGANALNRNVTGAANTASGAAALQSNTTGNNNTATGLNALNQNTTGGNNTASGAGAMFSNTTGNNNTALGFGAGGNWTTGSNNIAIANNGDAADLATIRIGAQGTQTRAFMAGIRGTRVNKGQAVMVDANGQLGVSRSSLRYKEDIHAMGDASKPLMNLRPVTFRYKEAEADGSKPIQYGLIAEEVEKVMPELVVYNEKGTPESVAYEILPSLLLNEYQKQGRELVAAKARLEAMEAEMAAMRVMLNRLAAASSSQGSSFAALESPVAR